jgi:hypothetical protein
MLLVCLNTQSETQRAIHASMRFAVNILGEDQAEVAFRFAKKSGSKFVEGDIVRAPSDIPMLAQAIARLDCRVSEKVSAATHTVFLAEVEHASGEEGSPLTYFRGRFGRFEDALQEAAYRRLRSMILARSVPVGEILDVDALAREMGVEGQAYLLRPHEAQHRRARRPRGRQGLHGETAPCTPGRRRDPGALAHTDGRRPHSGGKHRCRRPRRAPQACRGCRRKRAT